MFNIGPSELIVIFLVALLIVGPKRLPEIGKTIGKYMREFRRASDDFRQHLDFGIDSDDFPDEEPNGKGPNGKGPAEPATHPTSDEPDQS